MDCVLLQEGQAQNSKGSQTGGNPGGKLGGRECGGGCVPAKVRTQQALAASPPHHNLPSPCKCTCVDKVQLGEGTGKGGRQGPPRRLQQLRGDAAARRAQLAAVAQRRVCCAGAARRPGQGHGDEGDGVNHWGGF